MKIFYEPYIRLMVWLGATPPEGYEYLLPVEERLTIVPTESSSVTSAISIHEKSVASAKTETTELSSDEYVTEEDLPEWLRDTLKD